MAIVSEMQYCFTKGVIYLFIVKIETKKIKIRSYISQYPLPETDQRALQLTCSIEHHFDFCVKIQPHCS